jgi:hypothetical protein
MSDRLNRFITVYERWAALVFLIVALTLPRISAVLVEFIPGVDTVIICTGDTYVTIVLGPDGEPVSVQESTDNRCTLTDTVATADAPQLFWRQLALSFHHPFHIHENTGFARETLARLELSRAPPALI